MASLKRAFQPMPWQFGVQGEACSCGEAPNMVVIQGDILGVVQALADDEAWVIEKR